MSHRVRSGAAIAAALIVGGTLSACHTNVANQASNSSGPIKIGLAAILSGGYAQIGESHQQGAQLAVNEINAAGGIDGRKVQLVVKDEKGDPNTSVQTARDFIGSGVKLIAGYTIDPDCLAASPVISNAGGVLLALSCQGDALTQKSFQPGYFQIAPSNTMLSSATAKVAAERKLTNWQGASPDYDFGHEVWSEFGADLTKQDPSVSIGKGVFVPLTETQVTPYITSLISGLPADSAKSTGLFMSTFAATTIALAQQGKPYNFFDKYGAVLNLGGSTPTAEALGASTPPMTFIYDYFDGAYNNPTNTTFVNDYYKAYGKAKRPNAWVYEGYTDILAFKAAIQKAKSADPAKVRSAMAGMKFDSPKGPITFRKQDHLAITPVTAWSVVGDAASPGGFKVTSNETIPPSQTMPAPKN